MFQNLFQTGLSGADPFESLDSHGFGEAVHNTAHEFTPSDINIFHDMFSESSVNYHNGDIGVDSNTHFVHPHHVDSYVRHDGTIVEGYWRDGDGDTSINRTEDQGGGYIRSNPDHNPFNNLYSHEGNNEHFNDMNHSQFTNHDSFDTHNSFDAQHDTFHSGKEFGW